MQPGPRRDGRQSGAVGAGAVIVGVGEAREMLGLGFFVERDAGSQETVCWEVGADGCRAAVVGVEFEEVEEGFLDQLA